MSGLKGVLSDDRKLCVVMVGLPARGKSLIAQKVCRYLRWLSVTAKTFNVGTYRRQDTPQPTADFFSKGNSEGERLRQAAAEAAIHDMLAWLRRGEGSVALLDATNSTRRRRRWVREICERAGVDLLYVESKCDDEALIMSNIREVKTTSPDYRGQDPELAALDFRERIRNYERVYETIDDEEEITFCKIIDIGHRVVISHIKDYLQSRVVYYLMNLHIKPRSIYLSRHGESMFNLEGKIGGDAPLSPRGESYARTLPALVEAAVPRGERLTVWTSTLRRTISTARFLTEPAAAPPAGGAGLTSGGGPGSSSSRGTSPVRPRYPKLEWKALDELDSGACDGLTYAEIAAQYPADFRARDADKYHYRYLGGESYHDVVLRLEPIIMELERSAHSILIVSHQAIIRCIYAYYMAIPQSDSPWVNIPLHTLIKLTPKAYGTQKELFKADIPAVSTYRERGSEAKHSDSGGAGVAGAIEEVTDSSMRPVQIKIVKEETA